MSHARMRACGAAQVRTFRLVCFDAPVVELGFVWQDGVVEPNLAGIPRAARVRPEAILPADLAGSLAPLTFGLGIDGVAESVVATHHASHAPFAVFAVHPARGVVAESVLPAAAALGTLVGVLQVCTSTNRGVERVGGCGLSERPIAMHAFTNMYVLCLVGLGHVVSPTLRRAAPPNCAARDGDTC